MRKFTFIILIFFSLTSLAQEVSVSVTSAVKHENFNLGIGSKVTLDFQNKKNKKEYIFLGRMVDQNKKTVEFLFLDEKETRISMIDPQNIVGFRKSTAQTIIRPIDQTAATCTAYGVFHYWNQIFVSRFKSTSELVTTMESDRKRMKLLEEIIDIYYIQDKINITTLMNKLGKRFGFKCKNNLFTDSKKASDFLFNTALLGKPILIDFNIGPKMVSSTYELTDYETPLSPDPRLWIPRQVGERNSSGHVIVGAAAFMSKGRKKLLVLDSNWTEPRVWDLEKYIARKAAVKEMGFHTCEEQ